ncbi:MAG TPA: hypothetical protein VFX84_01870 [Candidatus Saccharimonadales bacterium]|nr:hypothetical protein [Candidatus Saccharimonadales bacterium]
MTATNHALTGAFIGLAVGQPAVAVPAALVSHFLCDAIPHWTPDTPPDRRLRSNSFRNYLIADASFCFLLVAVLAAVRPDQWFLAAICAFVATSPDFLWIPRYVKTRVGKRWRPNLYSRFALGIQWFSRPIGAVVEAAWFVAAILLILPFLLAA